MYVVHLPTVLHTPVVHILRLVHLTFENTPKISVYLTYTTKIFGHTESQKRFLYTHTATLPHTEEKKTKQIPNFRISFHT